MTAARSPAASLVVYGLAHAVIDAVSAGVVLRLWHGSTLSVETAGALVVLYNLLAFGAQPLLGLWVDATRRPRAAAVCGCAVMASAVAVVDWQPIVGVVLAGVGNAAFHLGGGSISLQLTPGRATAPGVFVAPGAIGLFAGTWLARGGTFTAWPFLLVLACLCVVMLRLDVPATAGRQTERLGGLAVTLTLLLCCVAARSLVGFSAVMPWKSAFPLAVGATVVVALGKAFGGVLADRLGWRPIAVGSLCVAGPLLACGAHVPAVGVVGLFLFNLTTAVTLVATANLLPGRSATAFGLTCLALELGAWPVTQWGGDASAFGRPGMVFAVSAAAAGALFVALRRMGIDA